MNENKIQGRLQALKASKVQAKEKSSVDYKKLNAYFKDACQTLAGIDEYDVDDENRDTLNQMLYWFCMDSRFEGDLNKGIILQGNVGSGKSLIFRAMALLDLRPFIATSCREVSEKYDQNGPASIPYYRKTKVMPDQSVNAFDFYFDDLGAEELAFFYGKKTDSMITVLDHRYEMYIKHRAITHTTTNLTKTDIEDRYGTRIVSRLFEMCNFITLGGSKNSTDRRGYNIQSKS